MVQNACPPHQMKSAPYRRVASQQIHRPIRLQPLLPDHRPPIVRLHKIPVRRGEDVLVEIVPASRIGEALEGGVAHLAKAIAQDDIVEMPLLDNATFGGEWGWGMTMIGTHRCFDDETMTPAREKMSCAESVAKMCVLVHGDCLGTPKCVPSG